MMAHRRLPSLCLLLAVSGWLFFSPQSSTAQQDVSTKRKLLEHEAPPYPNLARSMALQGSVKVEALVNPDGSVKAVDIKGGHPVLAQAAVKTVSGDGNRLPAKPMKWLKLGSLLNSSTALHGHARVTPQDVLSELA